MEEEEALPTWRLDQTYVSLGPHPRERRGQQPWNPWAGSPSPSGGGRPGCGQKRNPNSPDPGPCRRFSSDSGI